MFDEFQRRFPFTRILPDFTPDMAVFLETAVVPMAASARGPWDTATIVFDVRASGFAASLAKPALDSLSRATGHVARVAGGRVVVSSRDGRLRKRMMYASTGGDRAKVTATVRDVRGSVGLFFAVEESGTLHLLVRDDPLRFAAVSGENLTIDRGYADVWADLATLGGSVLGSRGMPLAPLSNTYDTFPRGRMIYHPADEQFTLLSDTPMHPPAAVASLKQAFDIGSSACFLRADSHDYAPAAPCAFERIVIHRLDH